MNINIVLETEKEVYDCTSPIFTKEVKRDICLLHNINNIDIIDVYNDCDEKMQVGDDIVSSYLTIKLNKKASALKTLKELNIELCVNYYYDENDKITQLLVDAEIGTIDDFVEMLGECGVISPAIYALKSGLIKINDRDKSGNTLLHAALYCDSWLDEFEEIFDFNPDLNIKNEENFPPIAFSDKYTLKLLTEKGCDINVKIGSENKTLVRHFINENSLNNDILKILSDNGIFLNRDDLEYMKDLSRDEHLSNVLLFYAKNNLLYKLI